MIGIDPGETESAIASFDGKRLHWVKKMANESLLKMIRSSEESLSHQKVVVEMIASFGKPVGKSIFDTCVMIGRIQESAEIKGAKVTLVYRKTIAGHICNDAKGGDTNIKAALQERFGSKGTKAAPGIFYGVSGSDQWSAIAIATWGLDNL